MADSPSYAYVKIMAFNSELEAIRAGTAEYVPEQIVEYLDRRVKELKKIVS